MDSLIDVEPVRVERTVYVAESWLPSSHLCPGCGSKTLWFPLESRNPHVCVECGRAYSIKSLAATDDHKTVIARIRQAIGWADAQETDVPSESGAEDDAGR